jgi:hypothetical protein
MMLKTKLLLISKPPTASSSRAFASRKIDLPAPMLCCTPHPTLPFLVIGLFNNDADRNLMLVSPHARLGVEIKEQQVYNS